MLADISFCMHAPGLRTLTSRCAAADRSRDCAAESDRWCARTFTFMCMRMLLCSSRRVLPGDSEYRRLSPAQNGVPTDDAILRGISIRVGWKGVIFERERTLRRYHQLHQRTAGSTKVRMPCKLGTAVPTRACGYGCWR
jgi:hypothetical protein